MQDLSQQTNQHITQLGLADFSDSDSDNDEVELSAPKTHVRQMVVVSL